MPDFEFVARSGTGKTVRGLRDATSDVALLAALRGEGLVTLRVRRAGARRRTGRAGGWRARFAPQPPARDVELELRQLSFLLRSGVTLLHALHLCAGQSPRRRIARVFREVADDIRDGSSLTEAVRRHRAFDSVTCSLVDVGENGGNLDVVLERAADILARKRHLRTQVSTALIYPALVLSMAVATVAYLLIGVIPRLTQFLRSLGRTLPPSTQLLIDLSTAVREHFVDALVVLAAILVTIVLARRTTGGRRFFDHVLLRTPFVGKTLRLAAVASFSYNLALLLRSGVRVTTGLLVVEPILPLRLFGERIARARAAVLQGHGLSESLSRERAFDPVVTGMVAVGESSGRIDEVLDHVADFHDARLREFIRRLGTVVEPVLLVVIGGIVGFVYLSFFAAVYSLAGRR